MVDAIAAIVGSVLSLVAVAASFYFYVVFCHRNWSHFSVAEEKGTGVAVPAKVVVVIGQAIAWLQIMIFPLDIGNHGESPTYGLYTAATIIIFILVAFVIPLVSSLYESEDDQNGSKRVFWALGYAVIVAAVWSAAIFISYIFLSHYNSTSQVPTSIYMLLCLGFAGWLGLIVFAGCGIIILPSSLVKIYLNGPKKLTAEEGLVKKQSLQRRSADIIEMGEKVKQKSEEFSKAKLGWFQKRRLKAELHQEVSRFKSEVDSLEADYAVFQEELKTTETPKIYFIGMLLMGILCMILSVIWLIQALGTSFGTNGVAVFPFVDTLLSNLSTSSISFLSAAIYGVMMIYLMACLVSGYAKLSLDLPAVLRPYPLILHKSYINALLFNCALMALGSEAITTMAAITFSNYANGSLIGDLFPTSNRSQIPFFGVLYGRRITIGIFSAVILITLIVGVIKIIIQNRSKSIEGDKNPVQMK